MIDETTVRLVMEKLKLLTGFDITEEMVDKAVSLAEADLEAQGALHDQSKVADDMQDERLVIDKLRVLTGFNITREMVDQAIALSEADLENERIASRQFDVQEEGEEEEEEGEEEEEIIIVRDDDDDEGPDDDNDLDDELRELDVLLDKIGEETDSQGSDERDDLDTPADGIFSKLGRRKRMEKDKIDQPYRLTQSDPVISEADGTANQWSDIWKYQVPMGVQLVIKPEAMFAAYLEDTSPAEVGDASCRLKIEKRDPSESDSLLLYGPDIYLASKEFQDSRKKARLSVPNATGTP